MSDSSSSKEEHAKQYQPSQVSGQLKVSQVSACSAKKKGGKELIDVLVCSRCCLLGESSLKPRYQLLVLFTVPDTS